MSVGPVLNNDPIDYPNLPPRRNSRIAHRLDPAGPEVPPEFFIAVLVSLLVLGGAIHAVTGAGSLSTLERVLILTLCALPILGLWCWIFRRGLHRVRNVVVALALQFPTWDALEKALRTSPHRVPFRGEMVREGDHVFAGCLWGSSKPVLLHIAYFGLPAIILGRTGIGKTKLVILPLTTQAIRRGRIHVVVLDFKGDMGFMRGLSSEAARARMDFRYLSVQPGNSSYLWNLLLDPGLALLSREQFIQIFLRALSLVTGQEGGPGYFGAQSEERLKRTLEQGWPRAIRELYHTVRNQRAPDIGMSERDFQNTGHLVANLGRLASVGVLNAVPGDDVPRAAFEGAISLLEILSRPGVTYLHLPAQLEPTAAMFLGKLWVHLLCAVAKAYSGPRVPVLIVIDEAQELVSGGGADLSTAIRQARESSISIWMGFQDLAALKAPNGGDFAPTLLANAPLKIFCSAEDAASRDYLTSTSGETRRVLHSVTDTATHNRQSGWSQGTAVQRREEATPRIDVELINRVNRDPRSFIMCASEAKGYTQFRFPVVVRSVFHISKRLADRRAAAPWPRGNRFTVTVKENPVVLPPEPAPTEGAPAAAEQAGPATRETQGPPAVQGAPEPTSPRRRGRPRKAQPVEQAPPVPDGLEGNQMAEYLKKLAGEVAPQPSAEETR